MFQRGMEYYCQINWVGDLFFFLISANKLMNNLQDTNFIYKPAAFLYTNNKLSDMKINKNSNFIITSTRIK